MENIEVNNRELKEPIGTVEYTEKHVSSQSIAVLILTLALFFFSSFYYLQNESPYLLLIIILCVQFLFKFLDNIPNRIWKLYHNYEDEKKE